MNVPDLSCAVWRTSKHSQQNGECVAVARIPGSLAVRDSKNPAGPLLTFALADWQHLVQQIKDDQHPPSWRG
ncbi:DUF397 domain-containing protein [Actinomadura rupiterrae]|uniref:DUF397 domain-containing protein n=1 Tax=Actinomadura rupiterrae TaxID=559627 RepID=UPI0020A360D6|nr:DUF397 domain-containing protein [Actinomadura rupiterrae]MCP2338621.1 hypothetical protein [Actinomadura rupiterrae]